MSTRFENTKATTLARMLDHSLLPEKAEARLARRIRAGDESATHELVRHNLRLAGFLADRFAEHHPSIDRDDLCSEAVLALYTAARKFDPRRGRFAHYAGFYVREALRVSVNVTRFGQRRPPPAEDREAVADAAWRWLEQTGREADIDQLAFVLGWKRSRVARALGGPRTLSLDAPVTPNGVTLGDVLEDQSAVHADAFAALNDTTAAVRDAVEQLEPRARTIIEHRFGLSPNGSTRGARRDVRLPQSREKNPHALRAVGAVVGLTGERIRQIERDALFALRRLLAERKRGDSSTEEQELETEERLLRRFEQQRIVMVDSDAESGLWFAAHRLTRRGVLRPGPCVNTWVLAPMEKASELRRTA